MLSKDFSWSGVELSQWSSCRPTVANRTPQHCLWNHQQSLYCCLSYIQTPTLPILSPWKMLTGMLPELVCTCCTHDIQQPLYCVICWMMWLSHLRHIRIDIATGWMICNKIWVCPIKEGLGVESKLLHLPHSIIIFWVHAQRACGCFCCNLQWFDKAMIHDC